MIIACVLWYVYINIYVYNMIDIGMIEKFQRVGIP